MTPDATPVFEVAGLTVTFGGVRAVDGVSFDLGRGQILGVIGPNGAGKTTVFDAVCGFVASTGRVRLDGRELSGLSPEQRSRVRLGRSFQGARLFPSLTVAEAMAIALERHIRIEGMVSSALRLPWVRRSEKRVRRRVEELIELMGLDAFRDKFVSELSTGSRRIVDLACIMAHDPLVLLLDEPSSGIAQRETEALGPLLLRIREETGASLLVIEHDMPLIRSVSDELLALETGSVLTRGKPDEVLEDPRLVSAYLGTDRSIVERSGLADRVPPPAQPAAAAGRGSRVEGGEVAAPVTAGNAAGEPRPKRRARRGSSSAEEAPTSPTRAAKPRATRSAPSASATRGTTTAKSRASKASKSTEPKPAPAAKRSRSRVGGAPPLKAAAGEADEETGGRSRDRSKSRS